MTDPMRLVIFDVDGTLVDSQGAIVAAMTASFEAIGLGVPERSETLSIVGLSLDHAIARLAPEQTAQTQARLVNGYKEAYHAHRLANGAAEESPLYPGAREMIAQLSKRPDLLLGIATGKSQRGLTALLDAHDLLRVFVTRQNADFHPSKPHPSMITTAMAKAGVGPAQTVMIGDTSYDMEMARAAKVPGIAVSWGYHGVPQLQLADLVVDAFDELPGALDSIWKVSA
ncbi:HAD-IA family hydrolase [Sedimentitalea todarodis]|uniref:HAD-IA family hydrolase n=1 Tax=Sedimentitalea todarodis TaxID=1631240 RepID=A0ABU3VI89_9RHOB|nr:HAD-IA family hydrolase [Sedimentitalea todarodis]MDU9005901.1 HAD-IA family hydrolase [Sedimentitalea todarodis]